MDILPQERAPLSTEMEQEWVFREQKDGFPMLCDMRDSGVLCDVVIRAGHERIEAHRLVLGMAIPYFRAMFTHGTIESRQKEIHMQNFDPLTLRHLIDFAYTKEISISKQNMFSLVRTSTYLQLDSVIDVCCKFMIQNMNIKNAAAILQCAQFANNAYGMEKADRYIRANFERFLKSEGFLGIPYDILKQQIVCDELLVTSEEVIFDGVIAWVKAEEGNRRQYLFDLLKLVRMPLLNLRYLNEKVCTEELIQQSQRLSGLMYAARRYHMSPETRKMGSLFAMKERQWREKLYSVCEGGLCNGFVSYYDTINRRWCKLLDIPKRHSRVHNAVMGYDKIYIFYCHIFLSLNLKTLEIILRMLGGCPAGAGVTFHRNQIYFFGRSVNYTAKKIFSCNPESATYEEVGEMLERRSFPKTLSLGEYIYIFGGYSRRASVLKTVERYDPVNKECIAVSPMLTETTDFDVTALNGKIYLHGQCMDEVFQDMFTLDVYNPLIDEWNVLKRFRSTRSNISLVTHTNRLFIMNRISRGGIYSIDTYDPSEDEWKSIDSKLPYSLPAARYNVSIST